MFIISIDGGLGNQMFEYAFFLAMQERFPNSKCYLDISMMNEETHNGYELERVFGIRMQMADRQDVAKLSEYCPKTIKYNKTINKINAFRRVIMGIKPSYIVQEDSSAFYAEYFSLNVLYSYYLRGVWANVKYFYAIKEKVLSSFIFPKITDEKNKLLVEKMAKTNSVSIHFRKGDYEEFGFEILSGEYYQQAIDYMDKNLSSPEYFIFSDDIRGAKENIGEAENFTFIDWNVGKNSYIDMNLMSLCKNNIIANSTFSFWGAYLNRNPQKTVIYPKFPLKGCRYPYAERDWIGM